MMEDKPLTIEDVDKLSEVLKDAIKQGAYIRMIVDINSNSSEVELPSYDDFYDEYYGDRITSTSSYLNIHLEGEWEEDNE